MLTGSAALLAHGAALDLKQLWDGIAVFRRFSELLGERGAS